MDPIDVPSSSHGTFEEPNVADPNSFVKSLTSSRPKPQWQGDPAQLDEYAMVDGFDPEPSGDINYEEDMANYTDYDQYASQLEAGGLMLNGCG